MQLPPASSKTLVLLSEVPHNVALCLDNSSAFTLLLSQMEESSEDEDDGGSGGRRRARRRQEQARAGEPAERAAQSHAQAAVYLRPGALRRQAAGRISLHTSAPHMTLFVPGLLSCSPRVHNVDHQSCRMSPSTVLRPWHHVFHAGGHQGAEPDAGGAAPPPRQPGVGARGHALARGQPRAEVPPGRDRQRCAAARVLPPELLHARHRRPGNMRNTPFDSLRHGYPFGCHHAVLRLARCFSHRFLFVGWV